MLWISIKLVAAAAATALVFYGAYIDGQRQKARNQHHHPRKS